MDERCAGDSERGGTSRRASSRVNTRSVDEIVEMVVRVVCGVPGVGVGLLERIEL